MLLPNRMVHYKQGVFLDGSNNSIFIEGSCNFTANGLLENAESISMFRSWGTDFEKNKIKGRQEEISKIVSKQNDEYRYLISDHILSAVDSIGKDKSIVELLHSELDLLRKNTYKDKIKEALKSHERALSAKLSLLEETPKFPFNSAPRKYQDDAYESWIEEGKKGIFGMATGTGKTITALNCLLNEYNDSGTYQAVILVPSKVLLTQWSEEVALFNFKKNIYYVSSDYKWKQRLNQLSTHLMLDKELPFIIISTYKTFASSKFQKYLKDLPVETLLIADEAHNMGSSNIRQILPKLKFGKRLALSATPRRNYDDDGNDAIEEFFNSKEPYTYSFSMERAIKEGVLCNYDYYPHIVSLTEEEMEEYIEISKKLASFFNFDSNKLTKSDIVEKLLLKRKRIVHKAFNKQEAFIKIIKEQLKTNGNLAHSFVYTPEGIDADGDNIMSNYLNALEDVSPSTRAFAYTSESQSREEVMQNFEQGNIDMLFSMKCLDEGVDIPRAELAIFCSSTGNPRQFIQRRGRVLRQHPDKEKAVIHDLVVIPNVGNEESIFAIEKSLIKQELTRVIYFASLSRNYYSSMEVCTPIAQKYGLDMFAMQNELGGH